ncbi:unnamed protein product [Gongylonema pulchrum]|uniref:Transcription repressor n=1 Tax=Gongylonema pulchrum TaxID=637853 RepID=A0A183D6C5_9BILA|nr:unnamed protein product [Gongylonema pulchrum]
MICRRNSVNCETLMFDKDASSSSSSVALHKEGSSSSSNNSLFMSGSAGNRRSHVDFHSNLDLTTNDFLAFLERMQSQRLDDQRCEMPDVHVSCFTSFFYAHQKS